jgi:hypothetical protein
MNEDNDLEEVIDTEVKEVEDTEPEDRGDEFTPPKTADDEPEVDEVAPVKAEAEEKEEEPANRMIPKSRFDEVNNKFKQLQEELATLKANQAKPEEKEEVKEPEVSVDDLEVKAANALMEGDVAQYQQVQRQIRQLLIAEAEARAETKILEQEARKSLAETAHELEGKYPELHRETGDQEKINEVLEWRDFLIAQKRMTAPQALRQAVEKVMGAPVATKDAEVREDARKGAAIEKAASASRSQPPALNVVGMGNRATATKINVEELTEDEFAALPVAEKKRLRGDAL